MLRQLFYAVALLNKCIAVCLSGEIGRHEGHKIP